MSFADPPAYLGMAELINRWHSSRPTIDRWRKAGIPGTAMKLHAIKLGRRVMFPRTSVEEIEMALLIKANPTTRPRRSRARKASA